MKTLGLILMLVAAVPTPGVVIAATNSSKLASNDWRQLWDEDAKTYWESRSEAELNKLAEEGQPIAQFLFSKKFYNKDRDKARAMLDAAEKAGLPQAIFEKGCTAFTGADISIAQRREGWNLMEKAASTGYLKAKLALAEYEMGKFSSMTPVKPNLKRALEYCRECADAGNTDAMVYLSVLYSSGVGEPRGQSDSPHNLLHSAAQRGNKEAIDRLIQRYAIGHGEAVDPLEAARLRFITHGSGLHIGGMPELLDSEGNSVAQDNLLWDDVARALSLFVKAGEKRQSDAAFALANQHREAGKLAESAILYRFARDLGHKEADAEVQRVEAELTPEQKARADDPKIFPFANPLLSPK